MFFPKIVLMGLLIYMCQWAVDYEVNTCKSTVEFLGCGVMLGCITIHTDRSYVSPFSVFINMTSKSPHVNMMTWGHKRWLLLLLMLGFFYFSPIYRQENWTLKYILRKCVLGRQISKTPPTPLSRVWTFLYLHCLLLSLAREVWLSLLGLKDIKKENTFLEKLQC